MTTVPGPRTVQRSPRPYEAAPATQDRFADGLGRFADDLGRFTDDLFGHLPRADQRRWAHTYLRGLLLCPGRKSPRRMAAALHEPRTAPDSLRQFVNQSPWDWAPARARLAHHAAGRSAPRAWVAEPVLLPKYGRASAGVHRRHVPHLGRTVNCQAAMGLFLASGDATVLPVGWSLFIDREWAADPYRRARSRVPDGVAHLTPEDQIPELAEWAAAHVPSPSLPLVASLRGAPNAGALIARLDRDGVRFVVEVRPGLPVLLAPHRPDRAGRGDPPAVRAQDALRLAGRRQVRQVRPGGAHGEPRPVATLTADVLVPSGADAAPGPRAHGAYRLLARQSTAPQPTRHWITNLTGAGPEEVLALTRLLPGAQETVRALGEEFGLLDFEGRSFPGWHHHVTLVSAAYAFHRSLGGL
ncbi:transposase [Streptomyces sp. NPDC047981]|uniref:IS701 family transposase n=1 Tax=Streptomyces sp. NPDC047981 TaxID=3154610 RepID=UPI00342D866E